jgi:hypothetical protein
MEINMYRLTKLFVAVIRYVLYQTRAYVLASHFNPNLIFASEAWSSARIGSILARIY